MGQVLNLEKPQDFAIQLLGRFLNQHKRIALGSSQRDEAAAANFNLGLAEGYSIALQEWINTRRVEIIKESVVADEFGKWLPAVELHEVQKFLRDLDERFHNKAVTVQPEDPEWWEITMEELDDLIIDEALKNQLERIRRQRVLAGILEPTDADETWLIEEAEKFRAVADPYEAAIKKLRKKQKA